MINFLNSISFTQKKRTLQQPYNIISRSYNSGNKTDDMPPLPMNILSGQILAMAEQDNKNPTGKKLDIFT